PAAASGVAVVPGRAFELAFRAPQRRGRVTVVMTDGPEARVDPIGGAVAFALTDGGIAVDNRGSAAGYRVSLPRSLAAARIRVAGRTLAFKRGAGLAVPGTPGARDSVTLPLSAAGAP
ncbi:MAG: hypothetical protein JWM27_1835, partial [Gemmatimonadetes bacterium]|nr:hypothetical protein [Gemmatimonadota bacterium]